MRVATYTQPGAPTRGSLAALFILVLAILFGTGAVPNTFLVLAPGLSPIVTMVWLAAYLFSLVGLMASHGINWISWLARYRILLVLILLGTIMSVAWSLDAKVSAERVVHLVGACLIAVYIGFTIPLLTTLRVLAVLLGAIMLLSIAAAVGMPKLGMEVYGGEIVWRGLFSSKNDLGFWSVAGVLLYVTLSDSTRSVFLRLVCYLMAGVCLALLGVSQSATSLMALLLAGALSLYLFIASRFQLGFARMTVMAVLFGALVTMAAANIDTAEIIGRSSDLTGRGKVWAQTWKLIIDRPLTGYGYGALWYPNDATRWIQESLTDFSWVVYHAHNGFLQVASEVGLPISVLALLMVAQQLVEIFYCQYQRQQVGVLFVLSFVVAYLVTNFSEARFLVTRELYWMLFLALPISMLRQINLMSIDTTVDDEGAYGDGAGGAYPGRGPGGAAYAGWRDGVAPGARQDKPWLAPGAAAGTAAGSAALSRLPAIAGDDHRSHDSSDAFEFADMDDADTMSQTQDDTGYWADESFDTTSGTLSLTETDIDLGNILEPDVNDLDDTADLTASQESSAGNEHDTSPGQLDEQTQGAPELTGQFAAAHDKTIDEMLDIDEHDQSQLEMALKSIDDEPDNEHGRSEVDQFDKALGDTPDRYDNVGAALGGDLSGNTGALDDSDEDIDAALDSDDDIGAAFGSDDDIGAALDADSSDSIGDVLDGNAGDGSDNDDDDDDDHWLDIPLGDGAAGR